MTYFYPPLRKKQVILLALLLMGTGAAAQKKVFNRADSSKPAANDATDRLKQLPASSLDTAGYFRNTDMMLRNRGAVSSPDLDQARKLPYMGINAVLSGRATGVDVRIPSAEPGKRNALFIRGASGLLLKNGDVFAAQPLYVIDGMPLQYDHAFAYDIQRFDFNRIGTEIDPLAYIDVNDIRSIEVLKDAAATAKYGPSASAGVIQISTRGPRTGELRVEVNGYAGMSLKPSMKVVNGRWERDFRLPFYDRYATAEQYRSFPAYLADSTNAQYYGAADWDEAYYRNGWMTGLHAGVSGGNRLASFRFGVGQATQQGQDNTLARRYNVNFGINITPAKRLDWSTYISASMLNRKRNQSLRDRMGDQDYILNLDRPPSPNKSLLEAYYGYLDDGIDNNRNTNVRVLNNLSYQFAPWLKFNSRFSIDYGQNFRDLFMPSTVNDGNNFASNFDGLQNRMTLDNSLEFSRYLGKRHHLTVTAGQYNQWDRWSYMYGKGYRGKSDYIKIYQPSSPGNPDNGSHNLRLTANFKDRIRAALASFYGNIEYDYAGKYNVMLYLRQDGSSNVTEENRWKLFPTAAVSWNVSNEPFLQDSKALSTLRLRGSAGRMGKVFSLDYYKDGPIYNVEIGWEGTPNLATYNAFPVLNAAYELGYVAPGIGWAYTDQINGGIDFGFANDRIKASVDVYARTDRDLLLKTPVAQEYGYSGVWQNGMDIRNSGVELTLEASIIQNKTFAWSSAINASMNQNKLLALPGGQTAVVLGNRRFEVGFPTDRFWLLQNEGMYASDADVPGGMTYQGIAMKGGDPIWIDRNGDNVIDDNDRIMEGSHNPKVQGGWANTFKYRDFELNFLLSYAFGRKLINENLAARYDFANREGADDIGAVKEVFYWAEPEGDMDRVPRYNPWSAVRPYQVNQTLFLEDGSYVRLRSLTLTYNFRSAWLAKRGLQNLRVYGTGNNLLTWTRYRGGDPEAFSYLGYDQGGYNWAQPKSFTLGFNLQF
ncbi:SusC/RagA family TonB-linked outer membrane protein [Chitinophaga sp. NPDC101104]|uniref:SusC/RagA family TonB-linked outer membrane protein n=1 Tax=Chitinophaga sp. NPDC101104 TaxID=3390561 RepID=UPI003D052DA7